MLDDAGAHRRARARGAVPDHARRTRSAFSDRSAKYRAGAPGGVGRAGVGAHERAAVGERARPARRGRGGDGRLDGPPARSRRSRRRRWSSSPGSRRSWPRPVRPTAGIDTVPVASIATGGGERFDVRSRRAGDDRPAGVPALPARASTGSGRGSRSSTAPARSGSPRRSRPRSCPPAGGSCCTDNLPGFGLQKTQVVYYADRWRGAAQRILDAMGCGSLRKAGQDVRIADVTILVGSDCPAYGAPGGGT